MRADLPIQSGHVAAVTPDTSCTRRALVGGGPVLEAVFRETVLRIQPTTIRLSSAVNAIRSVRAPLERYLRAHPGFTEARTPVSCMPGAPRIVRDMCAAAAQVGVGPMAGVAGAIAERVGRTLCGGRDIIVENGGDIFAVWSAPLRVGVYAGIASPFGDSLRLCIHAAGSPLGICTSSGTVGHSLSYGRADAAVIIAESCVFADALATATANRVRDGRDVPAAVAFARGYPQTLFVCVVKGTTVACWARDGRFGLDRPTGTSERVCTP